MATDVRPMTTKELLEIPDDGVRRWLIDGELRESPITFRNRFHSRAMACVGTELELWLRRQPEPRGQILAGEVGVCIFHDPDTTVGIDVVYVSHEVIVKQTDETTLIDGVPTLVVEIQSPSDTLEATLEKLSVYRRAKVPVVWVLGPPHQPRESRRGRRTGTRHRAGLRRPAPLGRQRPRERPGCSSRRDPRGVHAPTRAFHRGGRRAHLGGLIGRIPEDRAVLLAVVIGGPGSDRGVVAVRGGVDCVVRAL